MSAYLPFPQLLILRMLLGFTQAGCVPFASSLIADLLSSSFRGAGIAFFEVSLLLHPPSLLTLSSSFLLSLSYPNLSPIPTFPLSFPHSSPIPARVPMFLLTKETVLKYC